MEELLRERARLQEALTQISLVQKVYPSDANFLLVKVNDADALYRYLVAQGIIVRNRSKVHLCGQCLRITVGKAQENDCLLQAIKEFENQ